MEACSLVVRSVTKTYRRGQRRVTALRDVSFALSQGELALLAAHPDQARPRCSILWRHWTVPIAARLLSAERTSLACRGLRQRSIATSASGSSSILQPAPAAHSAREYSCADAPEAAVGSRARPETPRRGRSWRSRPAPAFGIERRRAAARRDCAGSRQRSRAHPRRRAGRQPRR